jgi:hypothetical protein
MKVGSVGSGMVGATTAYANEEETSALHTSAMLLKKAIDSL